jgi:glutathione peroxidase
VQRRNLFRTIVSAFFAGSAVSSTQASSCADPLNQPIRLLNSDTIKPLCELTAGKVCLLVNVASHCGFTYQYEALEKLHKKYEAQGFTVIGFPSGDFFQEKDKEADIAQFCSLNYGVTFPMSEKIHVRGEEASPIFRWLQDKTDTSVKWNFYKFLLDRNGKPVQAFSSMSEPLDKKLIDAIEGLL